MIFLTADFHFGHEHVRIVCKRPFKNVARMDKALVRNFNAVVQDSDKVFILGDLALIGPSRKHWLGDIIRGLNGTKFLILGNHDTLNVWDYVNMGFIGVYTDYELGQYHLVHDPVAGSREHTGILHGHVHDLWHQRGKYFNVGVDVNGFQPVSINAIT